MEEAVIRWVKEQGHKNSIKTDIELLRWLDDHLRDKYLDEIDVNMVQHIQNAKQETGVKNGTVNRVMALLRAVLNKAA
ncbi:MAG: phage integrase [Bacteroidia bacterium]